MASVTQPQGASNLPGQLVALQNGRWRCTVRTPLQSTENANDNAFPSLGAAYSDVYSTDTDETKFVNLRLIAQQFDADVANRSAATVLTQVYETLTGTFVGEVDDVTDYEMNGLKRVTRTLIALAGTSTAAYVVGTQSYGSSPTLYLAKVQIEENDAYVRVKAEYLEPGVVGRTIRQLGGGLREETIQAFYTRTAPTNGIVVYDKEDNEEGYPVWTVTAMQSKSGGSPVGSAESKTTQEAFPYPGRAKLFTQTKTYGSVDFNFTDLYLSNPVSVLLNCVVTVSYGTASTFTPTYTVWGPTEWASLNAVYLVEESVGGGRSNVRALDGYVVDTPDSGNEQTITFASSLGEAAIAFGTFLNTGFGGSATIKGGPNKPGGSTWTLRYSVDEAFVSTTGTQYYKYTEITCAVPAQTALPV